MSRCVQTLPRRMKGYKILNNLRLAGIDADNYIELISSMLDSHSEDQIYKAVYEKAREDGWQ